MFVSSVAWADAGAILEVPAVPASAEVAGAFDEDDPRVVARLLVDSEQVRPGQTIRVGALFEMDPHWHIYWRNSGEAGLSTEVTFEAPGIDYGPLNWPAPTVFSEADGLITTYGYSDQVLLFAEGTVAADAVGETTVTSVVDYLVCDESCIPGRAELTRTLSVAGEETLRGDEPARAVFDHYAAQVPRTPEEHGFALEVVLSQSAVRPSDLFVAALGIVTCQGPPDDAETCAELSLPEGEVSAAFVPDDIDSVNLAVTGEAPHPTAFAGRVIALAGTADADDPGGDQRLAGVLYLTDTGGQRLALAVDAPLPRRPVGATVSDVESPLLDALDEAGISAEAASGRVQLTWWMALLYAFLGGIILNVMPCVFPVLSIKVFSVLESVHKGRRRILGQGLAYSAGILATFGVLAGVVIALQAGGRGVGWGFHLQQPVFVGILVGVLVVFVLNLFGVFEILVSASKLNELATDAMGLRRSFFEGILAVVLATPCTAPFLGLASGFALASDPVTILVMFTAVGVGLAFPFVLFTLVPGLAKLLPKPGAWMEVVKQFLAFLVLGTVGFLVSVMAGLRGPEGVLTLLIVCVLLADAVLLWSAWRHGAVNLPIAGAVAVVEALALVGLWSVGQSEAGAIGMVRLLVLFIAAGNAFWLWAISRGAEVRWRVTSAVLAVAMLVTVGVSALPLRVPEGPIDWVDWSDGAVAAALAEGRPVLVDFTADWCVTCKANEELVIESEDVLDAIDEHNIAMLLADWTAPDERIRAKLAEYGRGGVPMVLVYSPDRPNAPQLLPEVLTIDTVLQSIETAARGERNDSL